MKSFLIALFFFISFNSISQLDCSDYHTGKFVVVDKEMGDNYITRTKKFQIETGTNPYTGSKIRTKDRIVWINQCTYKLVPVKIKDPDNFIKDNVLTFQIIETGKDYYVVHVTGIDGFEINVKVERL